MIRRCITRLSLIVTLLLSAACIQASDFVELVQYCEHCHGKDGVSTNPDIPIIAGFSSEGFLNTMYVFRDDIRIAIEFHNPGEPETVMNDIAKNLSEDDVIKLADYFSNRAFKPVNQPVNPQLAERGEILHKQSCDKCHRDNGARPVSDASILAGQWTPYLKRQFKNIRSGKRLVPPTMLRRVNNLSDEDIEALLNFYAQVGLSAKPPADSKQTPLEVNDKRLN